MSYHQFLLFAGCAVFLSFWLPRFVSGREPAASALLILAGFICAQFIDPSLPAFNPIEFPGPWEIISELAVIVALFATGMRIDVLGPFTRWQPTWRLLAVAMPLTIAGITAAGLIAGLPLPAALLLGAVLAPTDPVLAGDIQVAPPTEGGEHPVRFALTTEAGLNDGLAFPFVHLAIAVIAGLSYVDVAQWVGYEVVYKIFVGALTGAGVGWLLARVVFRWPLDNALAATGSGVLGLAGVLVCYGVAEAAHGYGFIACFVGGMAFRRTETEHSFHGNLHVFNLAIEHGLTSLLLLMTGVALGHYAALLRWDHVIVAVALILVIRPLSAWIALLGTKLAMRERFVTAAFGVRGIGSIYYLAYAAGVAQVPGVDDLWIIVLASIAMSTLAHGLSAGAALSQIRADVD